MRPVRSKQVVEHYVEYLCPGTFVSERSRVPCDSPGDVRSALARESDVVARYNAKPYAFRFISVAYEEGVSDSGEVMKTAPREACSGLFHIRGKVLRLEDIPDTKENEILRSNMRCNEWPAVVETRNSYRSVVVLNREDVVLDAGGGVVARGEDYY